MERLIDGIVRLIRAGRQAYGRKWSFLAVFVCVFFGSVALLGWLDLLPQESSAPETADVSANVRTALPADIIELPVKIEIQTIGLAASIANPTTTDAEALDQKLLSGAVRYPTSASLGEMGNVVLFGHSSYLPIVHNQAYKTFNGIQRLAVEDIVTVYSPTTAYTYRVRSVAKESANNNSAIPLSAAGKTLTLVTCDSFGAKSDRFVVVANFVEGRPISIQADVASRKK